MRAVTLDFGRHSLELIDVPEPRLERADEVLFRVQEGGVCGTDRELANFRFGHPPAGFDYLVLGHEAIGQVMQAGPAVTELKAGDWVAPMVRRPCDPACRSCLRQRRDLCLTGNYTERGIFGAHGYLTGYAVDRAEDLVKVTSSLADVGVLIEPLSVVVKAAEIALRLHGAQPETALVLGAGTVGILAALLLQRRGLVVTVHSLEPSASQRVRLLERAGVRYLPRLEGAFDLILEAAGSDEKASESLGFLAPLGVMVLLGAKQSASPVPFLDLIVKNQVVTGSVNAGPRHVHQAAAELGELDGIVLRSLIHRAKLEEFQSSILGTLSDKPKIVHVLE
jgi:threonine dehydrogenase-like Zn-dependent dehydrogenase